MVKKMSRYIDIEPYEKDGWYLQKRYHNSYGEVIKTTPLISVPTAEVKLKHGRWIDEPIYKQTMDGKTWDGYTYCSECKEMHEYGYRSNYCPTCGANMREVEE